MDEAEHIAGSAAGLASEGGERSWPFALLAVRPAWLSGALCALALLLVLSLGRKTLRYYGSDFDTYYLAGQAVRTGQAGTMYATLSAPGADGRWSLDRPDAAWDALYARYFGGASGAWAYLYPPPFAAGMVPLAATPPALAFRVWQVVNLAAYLASVLLLLWMFRRALRPAAAWTLLLLALVSPLVYGALGHGQVSPLVLLCVVAMLAYYQARRPLGAGICLALGALVKVTPILFLAVCAWRRQWRLCAACLITLAAAALVTAAIVGFGPFVAFASALPLMSRGTAMYGNVSVVSVAGWALGYGDGSHPTLLPRDPRLLAAKGAFYLLVLALSALAIARRREGAQVGSIGVEYPLAAVAILLLSPINWGHHLLGALVAWFWLAAWGCAERRPWLLGVTALSYLLTVQESGLRATLVPEPWAGVVSFAGLVLLWAALCAAGLRRGRVAPSARTDERALAGALP